MRGRLGRYALWQTGDYFVERGASTALIASLLALLFVQTMRARFGPGWADGALGATLARQALQQAMEPFAFVASLIAVQGIVANDRKFGYFRLLFAKPVGLRRYYGQLFVIHGVSLVALTGLLVGVYALTVHPTDPRPAMALVAIHFVALGGIGFLVSTLVRFDWVAMASVWALGQIVRGLYGDSRSVWYAVADAVLPPSTEIDRVEQALFAGAPLPTRPVLWLVGYGLACFAIGLYVVRRRALAE